MKRVYVASPYTKGDCAFNVRNSIDAGIKLIDNGYNAIMPLLTHFVHMIHPRDYETWMKLDFDSIEYCDIVVLMYATSDTRN